MQQIRRAEIVVGLDAHHRVQQRFRQDAETHARAGRKRFAVSAGVNHPFAGAVRRERRGLIDPGETQLAIRRVFEQIDRVPSGPFKLFQHFQRLDFLDKARRDAGRVLVITDEIEHFDALQLAASLQRFRRLFQMGQINSIARETNATTLQTVALHDAEIDEVGRVLHQDDVAGVAQALGQRVKKLLRAARDDGAFQRIDFLQLARAGSHPGPDRCRSLPVDQGRGGARPSRRIQLPQPLRRQTPQRRVANRRAVLQRHPTGLA